MPDNSASASSNRTTLPDNGARKSIPTVSCPLCRRYRTSSHDEVDACADGLKLDSIFAVVSRYSKHRSGDLWRRAGGSRIDGNGVAPLRSSRLMVSDADATVL